MTSKFVMSTNEMLFRGENNMLMEIIRIDGGIVTGQLEDGHIIDIDQKWLASTIKVGDMVNFTEIKPA